MTAAPGSRKTALAILLLVTAGTLPFAWHLHQRVVRKAELGASGQINDFERWMALIPRYLHERIDITTDSFPNPPVTMLVLAPLTRLSPARAQFVWACAKGFMAAAILLLGLAMVRRAGVRLTGAAVALSLAVWVWPVIGDVQAGQTNLLMLLPLTAGLAVAQRERPAGDWLAGGLLGLAIAIKVTPLAFLAYALVRRRWRLAAAVVASVLVWLVVVPALAFGWRQNLSWLGQWYGVMVEPYVVHGEVTYVIGQSVPSLVSRLLRRVPAFVTRDGDTAQARYVNLVDWPEPVVNWLIRGLLLAVVLAGLVWARRPLATLRSRRYVLEVGAVAAFMLWASQRTWVEHSVTLFLTLLATGMILSDPAEPGAARRRAAWALGAAAVLMALTSDAARVLGRDGPDYIRTAAVALWASVALVAAIVTARGGRDVSEA